MTNTSKIQSEKDTDVAIARFIAGIAKFVVLFSIGFLNTLYAAHVLGYFWDWFLVPEGIDPLSLKARVGIFVIILLFTLTPASAILFAIFQQHGDETKKANKSFFIKLIRAALITAGITLIWLMGAIWNFLL